MKRMIITTLMAAAVVAPSAASAQLPSLRGVVPGLGGAASVSAVDPDSFLRETIETTKYMMIAAAVLREAADVSRDQAKTSAYLKAVNGAQDIKELNAQIAYFKEDLAALNENKESAAAIEAAYARASAEQKERIAAAAYNFSLGLYRNVKLSQQAPLLLDSLKGNPRLLTKADQLNQAAELIGLQAKGTIQMAGSVKKLMTSARIAPPAEADTTKPKAVVI